MKKKALIYALLASAFVTGITACDNNSNNNNIVNVDPKQENNPNDDELSQKVYSELSNVNKDISYDDFLAFMFRRKQQELTVISYCPTSEFNFELILSKNGDFVSKSIRMNNTNTKFKYMDNEWVKIEESREANGQTVYYELEFNEDGTYWQSDENTISGNIRNNISIHYLNNKFHSKNERVYENGNKISDKYYEFINNEWELRSESKYVNGKQLLIFSISDVFNELEKSESTFDDSGNELTKITSKYINNEWVSESKYEYTYDVNGKKLTLTVSKCISNEWLKTSEYKYINNVEKCIYELYFNENGTFDSKKEYTYDASGNKKTLSKSVYINNQWVKVEESICISESGSKPIMIVNLNEDGTYDSKEERTYDENVEWNFKEYKYINDEWVKTKEGFTTRDNGSLMEHRNYELDLNEDNSFNYKYERTYDDNFNVLTIIISKYINNEWIYESKEENEYDSNGNEISHIRANFEGNEWVYDLKTEFTYDENGQVLTEKYFTYINNEWRKDSEIIVINGVRKVAYNLFITIDGEIEFKTETTYDANGNEISSFVSNYINGDWVYYSKTESTYDENGNKVEIHSNYINGDWVYYSKFEYTYDEFGNKLKEIWSRFENGKWVKMDGVSGDNKIVYKTENVQPGVIKEVEETYDKNDKLLTALEIYYWNDKPSKKAEITYDDNENVAVAIAYNYANDEWVLLEKYEFSYDEKGVSTGLIISNYVNDAWLYRTKQEYIYDANGNKIEEYDSKYVNGKWIVCEKFKKINGQEQLKLYYNLALNEDGSFNNQWEKDYDENGREILTIGQKFINNAWVNDFKSEYTYDEYGNIVSSKLYSYQNGEWILDEDN